MAPPEPTPAAPGRCLNCGTTLTGAYCPACGQSARLRPLSLWHLLGELTADLFDIDSRVWRSLLPLVFRPGYLTREYVAGRRARYVAPVRLYLAASVLFFVVAAITQSNLPISWSDRGDTGTQVESADRGSGISMIVTGKDGCDPIVEGAEGSWGTYWRERAATACRKVSADKGVSLERAAVDNIPVMMVIFIPVLALLMKLLYPLSGRFYAEHLVFFLHYHAFGFITLLLLVGAYELGTLLGWSASTWRGIAWAGTAWLALYLFIAMRKVYGQRLLATTIKFALLFTGYLIGLVLSLTSVILYTALTL